MLVQKDREISPSTANTWASGVEPYEFGLSEGWEGDQPQSHSFLFTDRGIYRPGDTVYIKGVARFRRVGELKTPSEGSLLTIHVVDSKSQDVKTENVKVTRYGTFSYQVEISKDAPTGYYARVKAGEQPQRFSAIDVNGSFRVEEYRAPQFRVDDQGRRRSPSRGAGARRWWSRSAKAKVLARYLYGGAMADAKVKWSVNRSSTTFSTEVAPDFSFAQETWWWDDKSPEPTNGFFASGNGRCDVKGELPIVPGKVEAPGEKPWTYTIEGEVEDVNRQAVAGRMQVHVHPAQFYVGLRASTGFMQVGTEYPLDTVVVDTEGKRVGGRSVDVSIVSRSWKSVKKKDASGGFSTAFSEPEEKEASKRCKCGTSGGDGPVPCRFEADGCGLLHRDGDGGRRCGPKAQRVARRLRDRARASSRGSAATPIASSSSPTRRSSASPIRRTC